MDSAPEIERVITRKELREALADPGASEAADVAYCFGSKRLRELEVAQQAGGRVSLGSEVIISTAKNAHDR